MRARLGHGLNLAIDDTSQTLPCTGFLRSMCARKQMKDSHHIWSGNQADALVRVGNRKRADGVVCSGTLNWERKRS
jgi:hypothetical protein